MTRPAHHRRRSARRSIRGGTATKRIRTFLLFEAIAFLAAALVHSGVLLHGYQHEQARTAESVISLALLVGLVLSWIRPERTREAGIVAQGFALLGTLVGVFTIIVGVGPQSAPDIIYHVVILAVLVWGVAVAVRAPRQDAPTEATATEKGVAAPRVTAALSGALALGVLAQATFAGGFLSGHLSWLTWHENLGDLLTLLPLASLLVGLATRRHQRDTTSMLLSRVALVAMVFALVVTGYDAGTSSGILAVHIPVAVAVVGLVVYQTVISTQALATPTSARIRDRSGSRSGETRNAPHGANATDSQSAPAHQIEERP